MIENKTLKKTTLMFIFYLFLLTIVSQESVAEDALTEQDLKVKQMAIACRDEVRQQFVDLINQKVLTLNQLFDTFYIPIPNTSPQKYHTQYDLITDFYILKTLDTYLSKDKNLTFVIAVDRNGYLPTHNSKYSQVSVGDDNLNYKNNRTKRIFNDQTGLAAARNTKEFLLQKYNRDTGELLADLSVPIKIYGSHWGAIRIGYSRIE